jgi:hypothetical protein
MSVFRPLPRRSFLRGVGATLALPWLEIMTPVRASGKTTAQAPLRFVTVFQPNGVFPQAWNVQGEGRGYKISPILEPLNEFRDDMIVLSGIDSIGQGHVKLTAAFLTGALLDHGTNGMSLDQMLAQKIGRTTRYPSLELGTEPPRQGGVNEDPIALANTVSWSSPTTRVSPEINPRAAFDRLFRDPSSPEAKREALNRKSVVDLVMQDAKSLQRRASEHDRQKIEEYLDGVRSVEIQLDHSLHPTEPEWTPLTPPNLQRPAEGIPKRRDEHMRLMMDILVLALQTDTTRVGTFMTAHGFSRQNFTFLDGVTNDHHGMSHHKFQPKLVAEYTTVSRWYATQVAYLLRKMRAVNEGAGSLLDNSIVLYGSEMKDGNGHVKNDLPLVLAGRGQGRLDTGRHVVCPKGTPLANLHLTLLQKFGVEADHFNRTSTGTLSPLI